MKKWVKILFKLVHESEGTAIHFKENSILENLKVYVNLDSGECIPLSSTSKEEVIETDNGEYTISFQDSAEEIHLDIILKNISHNMGAIYVDSRIDINGFRRSKYFSPEGAISICFDGGTPQESVLAHHLYKDWWTRPFFGKYLKDLPPRTQSILWNDGEIFHQILPVCGENYKSEGIGMDGHFCITLSSFLGGHNTCSELVFTIGNGLEPYNLCEDMVKDTLKIMGFPTLPAEDKRYPEMFEYLGWCSWDAFYKEVNEAGVIEKSQEIQDKRLPVKWMLIDDGWLQTKDNKLISFKEDPEKFPNGFKYLTNILKNKKDIKWVGVWHAFAGYWEGIDKSSQLYEDMKGYLYNTNGGRTIPYPDREKGFAFWTQWHSYLRRQGIDFVKVDGQSAINNFMMHNESVGKSARESHFALEASVGTNFDNAIINCMGMAAENIWNRPISSISRNSDDFVPEVEEGFAEHALCNAYNSYYHGQFYWTDWDMFWSDHRDDKKSGVLRAVSGGPVYVSDPIGETNVCNVLPLILKNGRIIRCERSGMPTLDCLMKDPTSQDIPLKIWNTYRNTGVIAVFNINKNTERLKYSISPSDVPYLEGQNFAVYEYFSRKVTTVKFDESIVSIVDRSAPALYSIIPHGNEVTPIGILDKYIPQGTVENIYTNKDCMSVELREGGEFGFISSIPPKRVEVDGEDIEFELLDGSENFYTAHIGNREDSVIVNIYF